MAVLMCDICGGSLVMDASGDFAICDSCGMRHSKDRLQVKVQEIKGTVEITIGEAEKERLLKNAKIYMQLKEYYKAEALYKKIQNEYPDDWRGWIGYAETRLYIDGMSSSYNWSCNFDSIEKFEKAVETALSVSIIETDRIKAEVHRSYLELFQAIISKETSSLFSFEIGDISKIVNIQYHFDNNEFINSLNMFYEDCKHNAQILKNTLKMPNIVHNAQIFDHDSDLCDPILMGAVSDIEALSMTYVLLYNGKGFRFNKRIRESTSNNTLEEIIAKAKKAEQPYIWEANGLCRYCGGKLTIFGNKCKSCGKEN